MCDIYNIHRGKMCEYHKVREGEMKIYCYKLFTLYAKSFTIM